MVLSNLQGEPATFPCDPKIIQENERIVRSLTETEVDRRGKNDEELFFALAIQMSLGQPSNVIECNMCIVLLWLRMSDKSLHY